MKNEDPAEFLAVKEGAETLKSPEKAADYFEDDGTCTVTFTLVGEDDQPLAGGLETVLSVNADGFVEFSEPAYQGGHQLAKVKAVTGFNEPVFKDIKITQKCTR